MGRLSRQCRIVNTLKPYRFSWPVTLLDWLFHSIMFYVVDHGAEMVTAVCRISRRRSGISRSAVYRPAPLFRFTPLAVTRVAHYRMLPVTVHQRSPFVTWRHRRWCSPYSANLTDARVRFVSVTSLAYADVSACPRGLYPTPLYALDMSDIVWLYCKIHILIKAKNLRC
jgi:hypothetical protein